MVRWLYWGRLRRLVDIVGREGDLAVMDYGCGGGVLLPTLSRRFQRVYGLDVNTAEAGRIVELLALPNVSLVRADGLSCPVPDECLDIVFAASVLEHFRDLEGCLREIRRILKPGGVLVSSSPTENWLYQAGRYVFRYRKPADHYHSARDIAAGIRRLFVVQRSLYGPLGLGPVGVYQIVMACKTIPTQKT